MTLTREIHHPSPLGLLSLRASEAALLGVYLPGQKDAPTSAARPGAGHPILALAARQLDEYFAAERTHFDVPLHFEGTEFQRAVWSELLRIPHGETRSYGALARALGRPGASRAVGAANARNPISIIAPCHRVIASSGALTGYGGGLEAKRWLLAHESRAQAEGERGIPGALPRRPGGAIKLLAAQPRNGKSSPGCASAAIPRRMWITS